MMKYCQGPRCHTYKTKDRIRGPKGYKQYQTRKRSHFYYGKNNFCDQRCMYEWIDMHIERALDRFGRTTEPQCVMADSAWYKSYQYRGNSNYNHYIVNDLLGERRPITEAQYNDDNFTSPTN
jgi:hypothetical protein